MNSTKNMNFGIIGNCKSAALINENGSIDWCCLPKFDSPSIFAKILDNDKGGSFELVTESKFEISQKYSGDSCILATRFESKEEAFELIDFMPRFQMENGQYYAPPELIRFIKPLKGNPKIQF